MIVPMSEAARLAGKSRQTLYNMVSSGKLSNLTGLDNKPGIELSELCRVFPHINPAEVGHFGQSSSVQNGHHLTGGFDNPLTAALQAHIAALERVIEAKDAVIAEKDARLLLLTDQRPAEVVQPPPAAPVATVQTTEPTRRRSFLERLADGLNAALK